MEDINNELNTIEQKNPSKESDDDIVHCNFKIKRKVLKAYNTLCQIKGTTRSKRLRNFVTYELEKENSKIIENSEKPKDLNTSDSKI